MFEAEIEAIYEELVKKCKKCHGFDVNCQCIKKFEEVLPLIKRGIPPFFIEKLEKEQKKNPIELNDINVIKKIYNMILLTREATSDFLHYVKTHSDSLYIPFSLFFFDLFKKITIVDDPDRKLLLTVSTLFFDGLSHFYFEKKEVLVNLKILLERRKDLLKKTFLSFPEQRDLELFFSFLKGGSEY